MASYFDLFTPGFSCLCFQSLFTKAVIVSILVAVYFALFVWIASHECSYILLDWETDFHKMTLFIIFHTLAIFPIHFWNSWVRLTSTRTRYSLLSFAPFTLSTSDGAGETSVRSISSRFLTSFFYCELFVAELSVQRKVFCSALRFAITQ